MKRNAPNERDCTPLIAASERLLLPTGNPMFRVAKLGSFAAQNMPRRRKSAEKPVLQTAAQNGVIEWTM